MNENGDMIQFRWRETTHTQYPPVLEYRLHFMPSLFQPMGSPECIVLKEIPEDMKRWVEVPTV
jgi:hypothetical protein